MSELAGASLFELAAAGNAEALERALRAKGDGKKKLFELDINAHHPGNQQTALHRACENGHFQAAYTLLSLGAEVDACDNMKWTALHCASSQQHLSLCNLLLSRGANPNALNQEGTSPMHYIIRCAYTEQLLEVLEMMLESGANLELKNGHGDTPLMQAASKGLTENVRFLLDYRADVNARNKYNQNALIMAVDSGVVDSVLLLLKYGAQSDVKDNYGRTPMSIARQANRPSIDGRVIEYLANEEAVLEGCTYTSLEAAETVRDSAGDDMNMFLVLQAEQAARTAAANAEANAQALADAEAQQNSATIELEDDLLADLMDSVSVKPQVTVQQSGAKFAPKPKTIALRFGSAAAAAGKQPVRMYPRLNGSQLALQVAAAPKKSPTISRRNVVNIASKSVRMVPAFDVEDLEMPTEAVYQVNASNLANCRTIVENGNIACVIPQSLLKLIPLAKLEEDVRARQALASSREDAAILDQVNGSEILRHHAGWRRELGDKNGSNDRSLIRPRHNYKNWFYHSTHYNYVGRCNRVRSSDTYEPLVISIARDTDVHSVDRWRVFLWMRTGDEHHFAPYRPDRHDKHKFEHGIPKDLEAFILDKIRETRPRDPEPIQILLEPVSRKDHQKVADQLLQFEKNDPRRARCFSIGVLYSKEGQTHEDEQFNNERSSPALERFLSWLGDRIHLKNWTGYRGDLDTKTDATGVHSVYRRWRGLELMFHVSTMLPYTVGADQQLHRKRRIGNDIGTIVFQEGGSYEPPIRSQFLHVYWVLSPVDADSTKNALKHRMAVSVEESMATCTPAVPAGTVELDNDFRDLLFAKMLNGLLTAKNHPALRERLWCKPKEAFLTTLVQDFSTLKEFKKLAGPQI